MSNDTISRQAAIDALDVLCQEHRYKIPGKRETYSQYNEAWQDALDRAEGAIFNLPPAHPELNEWCHDCKEYDKDHHCCPRWNRVIKTTLAEAQQVRTKMSSANWIPCSERLPNDNREVEVTCEVKRLDGKKYRYTCHASYVHRYSIESTGYNNWEECDEYYEEDDKYYALPGWYERVHNWDDYSYSAIEDYVSAWRELPEPYKGEQE